MTLATAPAANIYDKSLLDFWDTEFLAHALYTVSDRAIPFADSGLKPVQQRILYGALHFGAVPGQAPPKTQKLAGNIAGTFHPHGDTSITETMALMAGSYQRFNPLQGTGAFPMAPGDDNAAPRYTHVKLSPFGYAMVQDLKDGPVVQMIPTYDNETTEPVTLPVRFPALLIYGCPGGSMGVGWSSTIPAHNPREAIAAARAVLANPELSDDELCKILPGPDWGGGGEVIGYGGVREYLTTGVGTMTVSGTVEIDGKSLVITSLPPGVAINTLMKSIRTKVLDGRIAGISDLSDLSDFDNGIRIAITVKRGTDPEKVMADLRRLTDFETTFAAKLNALDADAIPRTWTARELLQRFLELRDSVVRRRSEFRAEKARARAHLVSGLLAIHVDIDKAVALIRASETVEEARSSLMSTFRIDTTQADHVLAMQLRKLTKLDVLELHAEHENLQTQIAELDTLIASPAARSAVIDEELVETGKLFSSPEFDRRTVLRYDAAPTAREASATSSGSKDAPINPNWRIDDAGVLSDSHGDLIRDGIAWGVWSHGKVKLTDGRGLPSRIRDTPFAPVMDDFLVSGVLTPGQHLVLVCRTGKVLRVDPAAISLVGKSSNGVAGMKLADGDAVIAAFPVSGSGAILSVSEKAWKVTDVAEIPVNGRGTAGSRFHPFLAGEENALLKAEYSATGYVREGKQVKAQPRAKGTTKGTGTDVTPAPTA